jgi:histidine triad (HIT) family protein
LSDALPTHAPPRYECPFCAIAGGADNPPWTVQDDVVLSDERTTAWINGRWWANNPGGVVVVPNQHVENIYALSREQAGDVHETARRIAFAMKRAYSCGGVSTRQHNEPAGQQEVWHYHLHVFPRFEGDELYTSPARLTTPDERVPFAAMLRVALASEN